MGLQAENLRLAEQVQAFSGDDHLRREAAPWRRLRRKSAWRRLGVSALSWISSATKEPQHHRFTVTAATFTSTRCLVDSVRC